MNLRDLRYLVALARLRHFSRAAEACHVSQPTLSAQIRKLEDYLGVQLVERDRRNVRLTSAGESLIERAESIVREADELITAARQMQNPLSGPLHLGLIPTLGPYLLPHVAAPLGQSLPDLQLQLHEAQTPVLLERLENGELDAALLAMPVSTRFATVQVFDERFELATPTGHPLAGKTNLQLHDLPTGQLLLLEEGHCLRGQALALCDQAATEARQDIRGTSLETVRHMVAIGSGITLIPELASKPTSGLAKANFADPAPSRSIALVFRKSSVKLAAINAVADVIRAETQAIL